jgi:hypothetical protein
MKTLNFELGTLNLRRVVFGLFLIACDDGAAQIQQAWVAHYNNGITNGTNQAVKMALDSVGNIYVTGFSQNTNTNLGYVTIKYAPNGTQLWAARYDSTNYPTATPSGLALDASNDVVVTGSALTLKYDPNGNQLWTAPYNGAAVAVDTGGNSIVTGYQSGFNTVKVNPNGTNVWVTSYVNPNGEPAASQALVLDSSDNVYVAGAYTYACYSEGSYTVCYLGLLIVKYDQNGNQLWAAENVEGSDDYVQIEGMVLDNEDNSYLLVDFYPIGTGPRFTTFRYDSSGNLAWTSFNPTGGGHSQGYGIALDKTGDVYPTGQQGFYYPNLSYATYKLNTNGSCVWTNLYPIPISRASVSTSISTDQANSVYVTGYSPGTNSGNDIVTIKYDPNGNQIWLQRYNGPGNGNDAGNAIAVDKNGNVYVTGYETLPGGGTGIVTIKYIPLSLQRRSDGTVLLEVQGSPGESFDIQASADLRTWLDLGTVLADTNGLMQFNDTNAPNFPSRFYYTNPQ